MSNHISYNKPFTQTRCNLIYSIVADTIANENPGDIPVGNFSHSATLFFHAQFRRCSRCSLIDYTNFYISYLKVEHRNINLQMSKLFVNI